jgi:hypothetical protein
MLIAASDVLAIKACLEEIGIARAHLGPWCRSDMDGLELAARRYTTTRAGHHFSRSP